MAEDQLPTTTSSRDEVMLFLQTAAATYNQGQLVESERVELQRMKNERDFQLGQMSIEARRSEVDRAYALAERQFLYRFWYLVGVMVLIVVVLLGLLFVKQDARYIVEIIVACLLFAAGKLDSLWFSRPTRTPAKQPDSSAQ